jgi:DnaJ-domain-containing protein 1
MSIGRRLIDLARAELNSLLERAANSDDDDGGGRDADRYGSADVLSDQELEAELERRKQAREEAEAAARGERPASSRGSRRTASPPPRRSDDAAIRQAYAALEIAPGSDFEAVRKAYRTLMRKYHPDLHKGHPDANKVAQGLTDAYKLLEKRLRR